MEFCINILLIHRWAAHILFLKGKQKGYHSLYSYSYKCRAVAWKLLQQSARRLPVVITKKCDKRWVTRKKGGNEETGRTGAICFTQVIANSEDICAVGGWLVVVGGSEDNTGNEDKPSNQKEGHKIQNHQEAKEHEVRLDTTSKVPCEGKETWFVSNVNLTRGTELLPLLSFYINLLHVYLQSFALTSSTMRKSKEILCICFWVYAASVSLSRTHLWKIRATAFAALPCEGQIIKKLYYNNSKFPHNYQVI